MYWKKNGSEPHYKVREKKKIIINLLSILKLISSIKFYPGLGERKTTGKKTRFSNINDMIHFDKLYVFYIILYYFIIFFT